MPRIARSSLLALVLLPLMSCIGDEASECTTCPAENTASLEVYAQPLRLPEDPTLPDTLKLDSIVVRVDGVARATVRSGLTGTISGLASGDHQIRLVRWYTRSGLLATRTSDLQVRLERGETRRIAFHNDFPVVSWWVPPPRHRGHPELDALTPLRMG